MKKILFLAPALALALISCGGGEGGEQEGAESAENSMKGAETDLTEYGMNYVITLPDDQSTALDVVANDWGGVEITKGEMFMIELAFGAGDLALLKSDLQGDLMYKSEIIEEGPDFMLYKREIPDSGMEPEYHFIYMFKSGTDIIEVQNMKAASFNEEAIRKMMLSAKSLKAKASA